MWIFVLLLIFIFFVALWFLGAWAFHLQLWGIVNFFGEGKWEDTFAPISALFAAFASGGALFAIIHQAAQFRSQQFESNFINLLNIHKSNKDSLIIKLERNEAHGIVVFKELYLLLKEIYTRAKYPMEKYAFFQPRLNIDDLINSRLDGYRNNDGVIQKEPREIFKLCHDIIEECIDYSLGKYFRHLYHTVKYVNERAPKTQKKQYVGILRAQFDNYEYAIIYYNTLMSDDKKKPNGKVSKFQHLIEKHCLLHNLRKDLLFDNHEAGRYSDRAFQHFWKYHKRRAHKRFQRSLLAKSFHWFLKTIWGPFVENFRECFIPEFD